MPHSTNYCTLVWELARLRGMESRRPSPTEAWPIHWLEQDAHAPTMADSVFSSRKIFLYSHSHFSSHLPGRGSRLFSRRAVFLLSSWWYSGDSSIVPLRVGKHQHQRAQNGTVDVRCTPMRTSLRRDLFVVASVVVRP